MNRDRLILAILLLPAALSIAASASAQTLRCPEDMTVISSGKSSLCYDAKEAEFKLTVPLHAWKEGTLCMIPEILLSKIGQGKEFKWGILPFGINGGADLTNAPKSKVRGEIATTNNMGRLVLATDFVCLEPQNQVATVYMFYGFEILDPERYQSIPSALITVERQYADRGKTEE